MGTTEVRVHGIGTSRDGSVHGFGSTGGVVEVVGVAAGGHIRHGVARVDALQALFVGQVGLLFEVEVAAAEERCLGAAARLEQQAGGVASGVADLRRIVLALGEARVARVAGAAVAVPEDLGVLGDEILQRIGDGAGAHEDDVDVLLGQVGELGSGILGSDLVDHDGRLEAVVLRHLGGLIDQRLVVGAVVLRAGRGDTELHLAVAVGVEQLDRVVRGSGGGCLGGCRSSGGRGCRGGLCRGGCGRGSGGLVATAAGGDEAERNERSGGECGCFHV